MVNILTVLGLGLLPSIIWLIFFLQQDRLKPEPKKLILYVFLLGSFSVFIVYGLQVFFNTFIGPQINIKEYTFLSFLFLGGIEEVLKFAIVYGAIRQRKEFDEPIDAMIYMITAALGFSAVEDIASVISDSALREFGAISTLALRFIGATLLHALASGIVGYYWGKAIVRKKDYSKLIVFGLFLATLLHATFNYLIMKTGPASWGIIFLVFAAFFIFQDFEKLKHANNK
jgi:RsiW-degrading membrane proteinase PrsW (M82 family)